MKFASFVSVSLFALSSWAAPMPVTSSSIFINSELGLFQSQDGFSIHAAKTAWKHISPPNDNPYIATMYRGPIVQNGVQPTLTVRTDRAKKTLSVQKYAKNWMKDYPRFGFQILAAKPVRISGEVAFLVDLKSDTTDRQLRQILLKNDNKVVILTCRDHVKNFNSSLKACNQIIRNFNWF